MLKHKTTNPKANDDRFAIGSLNLAGEQHLLHAPGVFEFHISGCLPGLLSPKA